MCSLCVVLYVCCIIISSICVCLAILFFFFFKQKTAYEMRISDWSSDVCSSDLVVDGRLLVGGRHEELETGSLEDGRIEARSEEHTSELQSLMRISYAVFCLKKKKLSRLSDYEPDYV